MEKAIHHTDWVVVVLLAAYAGMLGMRLGFPKKFEAFRSILLSPRALADFGKSEEVLTDRFIVLRNLAYFSLVPLSILLALRSFRQELLHASDWKAYLFFFASFGLLISLQRIISLLFAWVLNRTEVFLEHYKRRDLLSQWVIIPLFPLLLLGSYFDPSAAAVSVITVIGIAGFQVYGLFKSIGCLDARGSLGLGLVLLYLCASEIAPWWFITQAIKTHWDFALLNL